ncbi:choice-of-anchor Q domain-containing protein [Solirubrobacter soli]|uniref:choice-of-anchor Q domain-containing protein n=1 Tax=Solirubrobacter soli TaxID=363832 RepID=UPI0012FB46B7|nr:choice-of-anchor Q domain-containing protein [Solirubrobacter soli]
MRRLLPALVIAVALLYVPAAYADSFDVVGRSDSGPTAPCNAIAPGAWQCATLRDAVAAADGSSGADGIVLHSGSPYVLSNGALLLSSDITIFSDSTRDTVIQAGSSARVATVGGTAQVTLLNLTIQGGAAGPSANGGNIVTSSGTTLSLSNVRVTGGTAHEGGGIANSGTLNVVNSLIDNNTASSFGGGILNQSTVGPADLTVVNSTIAANRVTDGDGAGIRSEGDTGNQLSLSFVTLARNIGGGLSVSSAQDVDALATIFAANSGTNCVGVSFATAQFNVDDGSSCAFNPANNKSGIGVGLAAALSPQGGPTDVLTIPSNSPAVDYVQPCFIGTDQRSYTRVTDPATQPCDAGAFELSGTPPSEQPPVVTPTPTPTPVVTATPTPTPTPAETPVPNKTVGVEPVKGKVLVKEPGSNKFVEVDEGTIKNGSEVDTRKGTVEITTAQGDDAKFFDGLFKISQKGGVTTLTLSEALDCKKAASGKATAAAKKPKSRKLWGDGKGKFRTKGSYSAATVRGTKWLVQDTCTTTTTTVKQGVVQVEDFVTHKKITVRKKYVARSKK